MSSQLKLAYAGTPELAATILQALVKRGGHAIACVYTQPDRPAGRGRRLQASPVKVLAGDYGLPVRQPQCAAEIAEDDAFGDVDLMVVAAYGLLLPEAVLNGPRSGCINVHLSLLPRWRGAAPIQRAIQAGDSQTGVTIMQMDAGLDTGDILLQKQCRIEESDTAGSLHDRLAVMGGELLLDALDGIGKGGLPPRPQDDTQACYARKISRTEAEIDWTLPAAVITRTVRAFDPWPVTQTTLNGIGMKIREAEILDTVPSGLAPGTVAAASAAGIDVKSADRLVRIRTLQLPGKKPVTAGEFLNGHRDFLEAGG